jgi:DnaJ-class molecular chaperone
MAHTDPTDVACADCKGAGFFRGWSTGGEPGECWEDHETCDACEGSGLSEEAVAA